MVDETTRWKTETDTPAPVIPILESERLILRGMTLDDASDVQRLAGDKRIAATTTHIPHPYGDGEAEAWINTHESEFEMRTSVIWGITLRESGELIGTIGMIIQLEHDLAELGYWIGVPYWNNGYVTEAGRAVLRYGFEQCGLERIYAHHFENNPASGRVMQKLGMKLEGTLRKHIKKWGTHLDCPYYGILRSEYEPGTGHA